MRKICVESLAQYLVIDISQKNLFSLSQQMNKRLDIKIRRWPLDHIKEDDFPI